MEVTELFKKGPNGLLVDLPIPSLLSYVTETEEKLKQPLQIPDYAASGEMEKIKKVDEVIQKDPYALRTLFNELAKKSRDDYVPNTLRPIPFREYPALYRASLFASSVMREATHLDVLIQIYQALMQEDLYQATALSYLDRAWIYISEQFFQEPGLVNEEELCFLLGHEMGHALCCHGAIKLLAGEQLGREKEYSADRFGLIVCMRWKMEKEPAELLEKLAEAAVLDCTAMLDKISLANQKTMKNGWAAYDREELAERYHRWRNGTEPLPMEMGTHPSNARRALAMHYFSRSEMFYRYLGVDAQGRPGVLDNETLEDFMGSLRRE